MAGSAEGVQLIKLFDLGEIAVLIGIGEDDAVVDVTHEAQRVRAEQFLDLFQHFEGVAEIHDRHGQIEEIEGLHAAFAHGGFQCGIEIVAAVHFEELYLPFRLAKLVASLHHIFVVAQRDDL